MKKVVRKDDLYMLQAEEDEQLVNEAFACEQADFELLLHGSPGFKELMGIVQRSMLRLLVLERERQEY
jgi:hypothetical protein